MNTVERKSLELCLEVSKDQLDRIKRIEEILEQMKKNNSRLFSLLNLNTENME